GRALRLRSVLSRGGNQIDDRGLIGSEALFGQRFEVGFGNRAIIFRLVTSLIKRFRMFLAVGQGAEPVAGVFDRFFKRGQDWRLGTLKLIVGDMTGGKLSTDGGDERTNFARFLRIDGQFGFDVTEIRESFAGITSYGWGVGCAQLGANL